MFRFILGFILSIVVTNWAYSELVLVDPGIEDIVEEASAMLSVPTHDQWAKVDIRPYLPDLSLESGFEFEELKAKLDQYNPVTKFKNIKRIVMQKRRGRASTTSYSYEKPYEMVSGEDIFVRHL